MGIKGLLRGVACVSVVFLLLPAHAAAQSLKPEKKSLEIAVAAFAHTTMPLLIAHEAGYFAKYGLSVNISAVSAAVAVQGLISSKIDIYQGAVAEY